MVDPLVMPIGAMATAGNQVFTLVRKLREELGVNTTCGASNVSFGLPNRHGINNAFLPMAMGAGMTSAIMNPVALPVTTKKIEEKREQIENAGIQLPVDLDQETFVKIFGLQPHHFSQRDYAIPFVRTCQQRTKNFPDVYLLPSQKDTET